MKPIYNSFSQILNKQDCFKILPTSITDVGIFINFYVKLSFKIKCLSLNIESLKYY